MGVVLQSLNGEEVDNNEDKNFYNKSFKAHLYYLITFMPFGVSNKKIDTHHD